MSFPDMQATPAAARCSPAAADLLTASPRTCSPLSTVPEDILIIRDEGKPLGVVIDHDVEPAVTDNPGLADRPLFDILRRGMVAVLSDDSLEVVKEKLGDQKFRCFLVSDSDGQLVGIIACVDLVPHLPEADSGAIVAEIVERVPEI